MEGFDADLELVWPELQRVARPARERRRLNPEILSSLVVELCERVPLSVRELAALLNRSEAYVGDAIRPLVGDGSLSFLYPDHPKHPGQRYVAGEMAAAVQAGRSDDADTPAGDDGGQTSVDGGVGTLDGPTDGAAHEADGDTADDTGDDTAAEREAAAAPSASGPAADAPSGTDHEGVAADPAPGDPGAELPPAAAPSPPGAPAAEVADAEEEDAGPDLSTVVPASPPPRSATRTPPPSLFEPTHGLPPMEEEQAAPPGQEADGAEGQETLPQLVPSGDDALGERGAEPAGFHTLEDAAWASTPETRQTTAEAPRGSRVLTARQNIAIALAAGLALGLVLPPYLPLWSLGLAVLLAGAHMVLDSAQYQAFRLRGGNAGAPPPSWIVFFLLKTAFTAAEIGVTAFLTSLVRGLF